MATWHRGQQTMLHTPWQHDGGRWPEDRVVGLRLVYGEMRTGWERGRPATGGGGGGGLLLPTECRTENYRGRFKYRWTVKSHVDTTYTCDWPLFDSTKRVFFSCWRLSFLPNLSMTCYQTVTPCTAVRVPSVHTLIWWLFTVNLYTVMMNATKLAPTRIVYVPRNDSTTVGGSCECTDEKRLNKQVIFLYFGRVMKILRMGADTQWHNSAAGGPDTRAQAEHTVSEVQWSYKRVFCLVWGRYCCHVWGIKCIWQRQLLVTGGSCCGLNIWMKRVKCVLKTKEGCKIWIGMICLLFVHEIIAEKNVRAIQSWTDSYRQTQLLVRLF